MGNNIFIFFLRTAEQNLTKLGNFQIKFTIPTDQLVKLTTAYVFFIFGVLTPLSAIFQLYHGDPF
jgi:hypothetical protein